MWTVFIICEKYLQLLSRIAHKFGLSKKANICCLWTNRQLSVTFAILDIHGFHRYCPLKNRFQMFEVLNGVLNLENSFLQTNISYSRQLNTENFVENRYLVFEVLITNVGKYMQGKFHSLFGSYIHTSVVYPCHFSFYKRISKFPYKRCETTSHCWVLFIHFGA